MPLYLPILIPCQNEITRKHSHIKLHEKRAKLREVFYFYRKYLLNLKLLEVKIKFSVYTRNRYLYTFSWKLKANVFSRNLMLTFIKLGSELLKYVRWRLRSEFVWILKEIKKRGHGDGKLKKITRTLCRCLSKKKYMACFTSGNVGQIL